MISVESSTITSLIPISTRRTISYWRKSLFGLKTSSSINGGLKGIREALTAVKQQLFRYYQKMRIIIRQCDVQPKNINGQDKTFRLTR